MIEIKVLCIKIRSSKRRMKKGIRRDSRVAEEGNYLVSFTDDCHSISRRCIFHANNNTTE